MSDLISTLDRDINGLFLNYIAKLLKYSSVCNVHNEKEQKMVAQSKSNIE